MYNNNTVRIQLASGCNVDMSIDMHDNYYSNFTESQHFSFSNFINAGQYFPQIMQFAMVMSSILNQRTSALDIILCNVASGVVYTLLWFLCRFYKIPGLSFLSSFLGSLFFRLFLHFIPIAVVAFWVVKDWKVLLFCVIGGVITQLIKSVLFANLSTVKYHNEVVGYVAGFKYKQ